MMIRVEPGYVAHERRGKANFAFDPFPLAKMGSTVQNA
jgi:hypothetical protein